MSKGQFVFAQVPIADIPRSSFNRSHGHKTTFNAGYLIPIYCDEALPGDTFNVKLSAFARMATPIYPIMDNLHLDVFFFAVPNRLLWDHWQELCGENPTPYVQGGASYLDYLVPQIEAPNSNIVNGKETGGFASQSLFDYMGVPINVPNIKVSALWPRAYNLIWNEWFRDQNLQDPVPFTKGDASESASNYTVLRRGKRHDYFTSCLPWPQKGPGVELPISGFAEVVPKSANQSPIFHPSGATGNLGAIYPNPTPESPGNLQFPMTFGAQLDQNIGQPLAWGDPGLVADLSTTTAVTINDMRRAFQIQRMQERDARGGTRYTEILRSHFGVVSPDARLQRPEYLGGGSVPVVINPVMQTSSTDNTSPQGNLAAYGVVGASNLGFTKSFVEHSVIIGLVEVRADLNYQQGLSRMWSRRTRYDFYWPVLSHLGEQAVLNQEIYAQAPTVIDPKTSLPINESVFGYQERWAEYRYFPGLITGKFRSQSVDAEGNSDTLDAWHLAQKFESLPTLSAQFIEDRPPVDRVVAVTEKLAPQFIFDSHFSIRAVRPMPTYSVPGMIDHF